MNKKLKIFLLIISTCATIYATLSTTDSQKTINFSQKYGNNTIVCNAGANNGCVMR
jgi:hypothetical protein